MALAELHQAFAHIHKKFSPTRALHGLLLSIAHVVGQSAKVIIANPLAEGEQTILGPLVVTSLRVAPYDGVFDPEVAPVEADRFRVVGVSGGAGVADSYWVAAKIADDTYSWHQLF